MSRRPTRRWALRAIWMERARRLSPRWLEWALEGRRVCDLPCGGRAFVGPDTIEVYCQPTDWQEPDEVLALDPGPVMLSAAEALERYMRE